MQADNLRTSLAGDESLHIIVEEYQYVLSVDVKPRIACFFEQEPTNMARVIDKNVSNDHDA